MLAVGSNLDAFREHQSIFNVHAEIANRRLDFHVPEQNLHRAQVAGLLVDQTGLGPAQEAGAIVFSPQADALPRSQPIGHIGVCSGGSGRLN